MGQGRRRHRDCLLTSHCFMGPRGRVQDAGEGCTAFSKEEEWRGYKSAFQLSWRRWLPQGGVALGGEGLGGCRVQAPWMGTSMKFESTFGAGGGQLVGTWGQFSRSGAERLRKAEGAGRVGSK